MNLKARKSLYSVTSSPSLPFWKTGFEISLYPTLPLRAILRKRTVRDSSQSSNKAELEFSLGRLGLEVSASHYTRHPRLSSSTEIGVRLLMDKQRIGFIESAKRMLSRW